MVTVISMNLLIGKYLRPCQGELRSGDDAVVFEHDNALMAVMFDVLGHGLEAYHEAQFLVEQTLQHQTNDPCDMLEHLNQISKGRRGAAACALAINLMGGDHIFASIGNTTMRLVGPKSFHPISQDGVLGQWRRKLKRQVFELDRRSMLILHTDGVSSRLDAQALLEQKHLSPNDLARFVVDKYGKDHDDASCMIIKEAL